MLQAKLLTKNNSSKHILSDPSNLNSSMSDAKKIG